MAETNDSWLVKTEQRSPSPQMPRPPPAPETLDAVADDLLASGKWKRAFDPTTGCAFFFDVNLPVRRTWNLRAWLECQIVAHEVSVSLQTNSPTRGDPLVSAQDDWRERIIALYAQHNPSKLLVVDELLARYKDREAELWRNLMSKYGGPRSPPVATPLREEVSSPAAAEIPAPLAVATATPPRETSHRQDVQSLSPREQAEIKARALLGKDRHVAQLSRKLSDTRPRASTPTRAITPGRTGVSPRVASPAAPRSPRTGAKSPAPRLSPTTSRAKSPGANVRTTLEDEWADDLVRRRAEVVARREALALQRREARERREAQVATRAAEKQRLIKNDAQDARVSPVRTTSATRVVRDRVSLIERQAAAAEALRTRQHEESNRGHEGFDVSSPMISRGWKASRQIEYAQAKNA